MNRILKFKDFIEEMASYKTTYKKPFKNFVDEFDEYKDFVICKNGNDFVFVAINNDYCIIPFNSQSENKCLPVVVWKNILPDAHISSEKFLYNLETELRKMVKGTFEEFTKLIGRSYRYDVNIVVDNTLFIDKEDFKNFIVNCFKKYNLTNKKRETQNTAIEYVNYLGVTQNIEASTKREEPEEPEITIENNVIYVNGSRPIFKGFYDNKKYKYLLEVDEGGIVPGISEYIIREYEYAAKGIYVQRVYVLPDDVYEKKKYDISRVFKGNVYEIPNMNEYDLVDFILYVSKNIATGLVSFGYDIDYRSIFTKYNLKPISKF